MNQELEKELTKLIKHLNTRAPAEESSRFVRFINSPFFLTFIAGGFLTISSILVTNLLETKEKENTRHIHLVDAKANALRNFTNKIDLYLEISIGVRQRNVWLFKYQETEDKKELKYPDGRSYTETRDLYENQRLELLKAEQGSSICLYTKAAFTESPESLILLENLETLFDRYKNTWSEDELNEIFREILILYPQAATEMAQHVFEKTNE